MAPRKAGTPRPKKTTLPEDRKVFTIDVKGLDTKEAEAYVNTVMEAHKNTKLDDDAVVKYDLIRLPEVEVVETTGVELHNVLKRTIEGLQRPDKQTYEPTVYEIGANPAEEIRLLGFKVVLDETIKPGTAELVGPNGKVVIKWA